MWPAGGNIAGGEAVAPTWPGQWPVNQNMYQNIPHEQVDWAALAQQWIQMRETDPRGRGGSGGDVVVDMGNLPPYHGVHGRLPHHLRLPTAPLVPPVIHGPPSQHRLPHPHLQHSGPGPHPHPPAAMPPIQPPPPAVSSTVTQAQHTRSVTMLHSENANSQDGYGQGGSGGGGGGGGAGSGGGSGSEFGSYWGPGWGPPNAPQLPHQHHPHPLPNWTAPSTADRKQGAESFDYSGDMHGNHGYTAQTYDYNHGTDHVGLTQGASSGIEHNQFNQYWGQGGPAAPPFLRRDINDFVDPVGQTLEDGLDAIPSLDAAKRKNLPAWIRDGLEKMEREKQKKLDREEMLRQRELRLLAQRDEDEKAVREFHAHRNHDDDDDGVVLQSKSKFESDSDADNSEDAGSGESRPDTPVSSSRAPKRSPSSRTSSPPAFAEPPKAEKERMEEMMIKVRRLLTEILLEVTNEEIGTIAREVFNKARAKAPARQLAKSSALASITGNLGLGGYSSNSDDSEGSDYKDDDDSEAELRENMNRRRLEFARREKEFASTHLQSDDASMDSTNDVKQAQEFQDSDDAKQDFQDSPANDAAKSKAQSDFEKKWYSEGVVKEEVSIATAAVVSATATSAETTTLTGADEVRRKEADDCRLETGVIDDSRKAKRDAKRSDSDRSRSRSRDRNRTSATSSNRRSSTRRHRSRTRSRSRSREKRSRRDSTGRDRVRTTSLRSQSRRSRSRSANRSRHFRTRRSRSRSADTSHRSAARRKRSSSSTSSSSSSTSSSSSSSAASYRKRRVTVESRKSNNSDVGGGGGGSSRSHRQDRLRKSDSSRAKRRRSESTSSSKSSSSKSSSSKRHRRTSSKSATSKHRNSRSRETGGSRSRRK